MTDRMEPAHHVVIIGGGFGGLYAVNRLRRSGARVTLVDRRNFHLFQPLLYQVATGGLSPANIASPLRACCANSGTPTWYWAKWSTSIWPIAS